MNTIKADSLNDLPEVAAAVIESLEGRNIVALRGEMGAGKTTLITEICNALGVKDTVTSPTFALVNEYRDRDDNPVFHFDFYRINKIEEAFDLGYEEYFDSGKLCLIEWPEQIESLLPDNIMTVRIEIIDKDSRRFTIS